ncbi:MAG: phenylalanine--tRNA ligase subunit beta [Candidatus Micrarchaeota archaeon]
MVTTAINKIYLLRLIGKKLSDQQLEESLHQIKAPIDSIDGGTLNIEVTGDRPDLLSAEGIGRSLKGYLGIEKGLPDEKFKSGGGVIFVEPSVREVREFIVAAVIENVRITDDDLKDLIQIQEKLTLTHGRKRKKVAIGLHDAKSLVGPFIYKAVDPDSVLFVPLGKTQKMTMREIAQKHEKGIEYGGIVSGARKWPIIVDSKNQVLSFPPIINGTLTELSTSTKTIFVDITGTDFHSCNIALNIICQDFSDRGALVRTVEIRAGSKTIITPQTAPEKMLLSTEKANKLLGTELSQKQIIEALGKQRISATIKSAVSLECLIPRYRADFLHPVDLIEEVALGFGYNNFEPKAPSVFTKGGVLQRTKFIDSMTDLMVGAGFLQINTPILANSKTALKSLSEIPQIKINNPVSEEYEYVRSSLLPHLLDALSKNTHNPYPQKLFEIGQVAKKDDKSPLKATNDLHLAAVFANSNSNLSDISGTLLSLLDHLKISHNLSPSLLKVFIPGRQGKISGKFNGKGGGSPNIHAGTHSIDLAFLGEINPQALENLKIEVPVCGFEIDLESYV